MGLPAEDSKDAEWPTFANYPLEVWESGTLTKRQDTVAEEVPVALIYNGLPHVVMLASPQDLEDFALGFSLSEGIIEKASEVGGIETEMRAEGIAVHLSVPRERVTALEAQHRNLAGRSGCGLCGAETFEQAIRNPAPVGKGVHVLRANLLNALRSLQSRQTINKMTGSVHGAAWATAEGEVLLVREDIGRHNALDKLIGALMNSKTKLDDGFAIITSRASFEMVQKAATVGISFIAAISAPTGLAIRLANKANLTLVGFARNERHVVYAHPERLTDNN